ncbi:hypothetical protein KIPB_007423, partial [Kipferlia bialata]|eukprot:g7423.t1
MTTPEGVQQLIAAVQTAMNPATGREIQTQ